MTEDRPASEPTDDEEAGAKPEQERDVVAEAATPSADPPQGRRVLAAVFWLLASLSVLVGGITVWAHQTLLTSGGWGGLMAEVVSDREVTDAVSVVLVDRLSDSLGVEELVADTLPGPDFIAGAVTGVVQDRVTGAVQDFAASDAFENAFVNVNKAAHDAAMKAIRGGDSEALTSDAGVISINIFPLIEGLLANLQDAGLIDASREIPDLSDYEASPTAVALIEKVLGRDIPDDVGTIVLVESERLELVQNVIRWFDLITIVVLLLWAAFTALALWLAHKRLRMVLWLSAGAIIALLAGRFVTRLVLESVMRRQPELEARVLVSAVIDAAVDSLMWFTFILILVAAIVAIGAFIWERRDGLARPAMETPPRTLGRWVRDNALVVLAVGVAIIGIVALWSIGGPGIALLTAAALLLLAIAIRFVSEQADEHEGEPAPDADSGA